MAALVSIGGFDFPEPSTYNATTSAIVDSAFSHCLSLSILIFKGRASHPACF